MPKMQGIERARLLIACTIAVVAASVIITVTLLALNKQAVTPNTTDVAISGEITCLPHKITSGPQTQECALGIRTDDNHYYALKNAPAEQTSKTGTRMNVRGTLTVTVDSAYDVVGTIQVTNITP